jgi:hypothetical protein
MHSAFATLHGMEGTTSVNDYCSYSLHVYPSPELQSEYRTNMPMVYSAAVVVIYLITSAFFVLYDILVQRRQAKVMDTAVSEKFEREKNVLLYCCGRFMLSCITKHKAHLKVSPHHFSSAFLMFLLHQVKSSAIVHR